MHVRPLRLNYEITDPLTLTCRFKEPTNLPLLLVLGLQFMEQYEGFCYPLREKEYNSMAVVRAER